MIRVLLFGQLTDICGTDQLQTKLFPDTDALLEQLIQQYPSLQTTTFAIAVNNQQIKGKHLLHDNDIVALLPPFSGG